MALCLTTSRFRIYVNTYQLVLESIEQKGWIMARKKFTTTLDEKLIQELKMQAVKEKTGVSKLIEKMAIEYLKKAGVKEWRT